MSASLALKGINFFSVVGGSTPNRAAANPDSKSRELLRFGWSFRKIRTRGFLAMGGIGSGRYGGTATAEATASYVFTARALAAALREGPRLTGVIQFDEGNFPVEVRIDISDPRGAFVELAHLTRDPREGDRLVRDRVRLIWTVPTYGGRRWWFLCPRTYQKTTKLYLPNGCWHFWSRQAYRLGYACQREGHFDRLRRRAAKLNRELGGEGSSTWNVPPEKPKWMRWRTYERKYEIWRRVVEKADGAFGIGAQRWLNRLG
jgi:hypothetical protein